MSNIEDFLVSNSVRELFSLEAKLGTTGIIDIYKAYDKSHNKGITVLIYKDKFFSNDPLLPLFVKRMSKIARMRSGISNLNSIGLDPTGVLFCVVDMLDGFPILKGNLDFSEAERRWTRALQIVEEMHSLGLAVGDLSEESFWINKSLGELELVCPIGAVNSWSDDKINDLYAHDAYSICLLGIDLFLRSAKVDKNFEDCPEWEDIIPITVPRWIKEVLAKGVSSIPSRRYKNILAVLEDLRETKEKILVEESQLQKRQNTNVTQRNINDGVAVFGTDNDSESQSHNEDNSPNISRKRKLIAGGIFGVLFLALFLVLFIVISDDSNHNKSDIDQEYQRLSVAANDQQRSAIDTISDNDAELEAKKEKILELQNSDDPLANSLLVESALSTTSVKERVIAENAILKRAERLGVVNALPVVRIWLDSTNPTSPPPEYPMVLKSIDGTAPINVRLSLLERIYSSNKELTIKMLAGFIFDDLTKINEYDSSARVLLNDFFSQTIPSEISTLSALSAHSNCYFTYVHKFNEIIDSFKPSELNWVVSYNLSKDLIPQKSIVEAALKKSAFGPSGEILIRSLTLDDTMPEGMLNVLSRLLQKQVSLGDIEQLGAWLHPEAVSILSAILLIPDLSDKLIQETIDYISGKESSKASVVGLIQWLQKNQWENRVKWGPIIGLLIISETKDVAFLSKATSVLNTVPKGNKVFSYILSSSNQSLIEHVLKNFNDKIPSSAMVSLLGNESKSLKLAAINALADVTETNVLQLIRYSYENEKDPEVKLEYENKLWVIKQLKNSKQ